LWINYYVFLDEEMIIYYSGVKNIIETEQAKSRDDKIHIMTSFHELKGRKLPDFLEEMKTDRKKKEKKCAP